MCISDATILVPIYTQKLFFHVRSYMLCRIDVYYVIDTAATAV